MERLLELGVPALRLFAEAEWTVVLTGARTWDPAWSRVVPLVLDVPAPTATERQSMWAQNLDGDAPADLDPSHLTVQFRLGPEQVERAASSARTQSSFAGRPLDAAALQLGARAQNTVGLERLARRIEPAMGWEALVLPPETLEHLHELTARVRYRGRVLDEWALRGGTARGRGITALFAGESGTGKTHVGRGASPTNSGSTSTRSTSRRSSTSTSARRRRTSTASSRRPRASTASSSSTRPTRSSASAREVQDAHDRYANVEVAYLLQRMEAFDGIAILATNLRANLDEAFARRLDAIVDFPVPDEEQRRRLWDRCLARASRVPTTSTSTFVRARSNCQAATSATSPSRPHIAQPGKIVP